MQDTQNTQTPTGYAIRATAGWRDYIAAEFPEDARNAASAEALRSLADYVDSLDGDQRIAFLDCNVFATSLGGEEPYRQLSRYGFNHPIHPIRSHLQHDEFVNELVVFVAEDAYESIRDLRGTSADDDDAAGQAEQTGLPIEIVRMALDDEPTPRFPRNGSGFNHLYES